jgi:GNAT superfamily N-acetyltransferase
MNIRPATKDDITTIWQLTREIAEYEKALEHFKVTEDYFLKNLFGDRPLFECYLIEDADETVGMGEIFITPHTYQGGYTLNLQDFIIREKYRGKGYGEKFMKFIARLALDRECSRINWSVIDWNEPAIKFYEKIGAIRPRNINLRLTEEVLRKIAE